MSIKRLIAMGLAASVLMTAATGCGKAADTGTNAPADSGTTANNAGSTTPNDAGSMTSSETPIEEPSPSPGKEEVNDSSNETSDSAAYTKEKAAAISALTNRQKSERDTVYVYKDFSKTANHFTQKAMAGKDDSLVKDMDENWQEDPYSGTSCIRCEVSTRIEDWGGWLFLNGYLPKGETVPLLNDGSMDGQGLDLTGATELRFMAKGDRSLRVLATTGAAARKTSSTPTAPRNSLPAGLS